MIRSPRVKQLNAIYDRMGSPRELNRAIGTLAWPLKEKAVPNLRGHPKEQSHPGNSCRSSSGNFDDYGVIRRQR